MIQRITECCVEEAAQLRLDHFLSSRFTYLSRSGWQKEIKNGNIEVNGAVQKSPATTVRLNDRIRYYASVTEEPPVDSARRIIFEDEYFVAVEKSGDLPVHPSGAYFNNTLLTMLESDLSRKLYMIHRIDRETSGVILFAKTSESASLFQLALEKGKKTYVAIVTGNPPDAFENKLPIGNAYPENTKRDDIVRKKRAAFDGANESAETDFVTVVRLKNFALVKAFPKTGRLHQIRVHLHSCGYPIVGDKLYGKDERLFIRFIEEGMTDELENELLMKRCALHALSVEIVHPFTKQPLKINSPLPRDFISFIRNNHG